MAKAKKKTVLTIEERLKLALVPEVEQPYPVPENWCWTKIKSISDVVTGGTPSKKKPEYYGGHFPFFKPADLDSGRHTCIASEYLSDKGKNVARLIPANSTAVCCIGTIGKSGFLVIDGTTNQQINSAIPKINSLYLYYFCNTSDFINQLLEKSSSTTISIVNKSKMEECKIPVAPLSEQQRIVDRIENLFAKLDKAKEKAQAALDSFETRKAAILHKAFTGELTAKWREENGVGMDSWTNVFIKDLGSCKLGKMLDSIKNEGNYTKYLRNINVRWFDFELSDIAQMKVNESEMQKYSIKPGDLFICEGGEPGRCAVWVYEDSNMIFQKALHRFRPYKKTSSFILAYYFLYLNQNGKLQNYFTGTTIKHLTGKSLAQIPIHLPTPSEQVEIVRLLDDFFVKEQKAKEFCSVLEKIELIKKSILARAFRGELGTNDLTEESAMDLLKSIV